MSEVTEPKPAKKRPQTTEDFIQEIRDLADSLNGENITRGEAKMLAVALKELRYAFKVFAKQRGKRKVTVFGSARTSSTDPVYKAAVEFGRLAKESGYMVITGAGGGIMEAAHVGAGREFSMGLNIVLPFEQSANPIMQGNPNLISMRYFFTRKLMFVKETDAVILFPGGFGTHDEGFEVLTLVQTGKSHLFPIVMVDVPGGTYWKQWDEFIRQQLGAAKLISPPDTSLYKITDSVEVAIQEVRQFYHVYHSSRYVRKELVLRLNRDITDDTLDRLNAEFKDIIWEGDIRRANADPVEANEPELLNLPRLRFCFNRHGLSRLRQMIDVINLDESHITSG